MANGISAVASISYNTRISMAISSISGGAGIAGQDPNPPSTVPHILTEDGNILTTEAGDRLVTEP